MGLFKPLSSSSYDSRLPNPQPDPYNYNIVRHAEIYGNLVVEVRYPNCTTYEGRKILVYRNVTLNALKAQRTIDPHFSENKYMFSPFARFEPTIHGWEVAKKLAETLI